jgi:hypothetical protein
VDAAAPRPARPGERKQERNVGIRETINKNPAQTTAITAGIVLLAIIFIFWQACGGGGSGVVGKSYYTVDDGKTFFVDASNKIPPFMKDGKQAVRAHVFTCDGGKTKFVGYLESYSPQDKQMMENAMSGKAPPAAYAGYTGQAMVKKPGMPQWIPLMPGTTQMYAATVQVTCPNGSDTPERVYPD